MTSYNPLPSHLRAVQEEFATAPGMATPSYGGQVNTGVEWDFVVGHGRHSRTPSRSPHRSQTEPRTSSLHEPSPLSATLPASSSNYGRPTTPPSHIPLSHPPPITEEHAAFVGRSIQGSQAAAAAASAAPVMVTNGMGHEHASANGRGDSRDSRATGSGGGSSRAATSARSRVRMVGDWQLQKTLGAGSMGKVKLATNVNTREKCAVKIVPRYESASRREEPRTAEEAEKLRQKDENKEVRTIREAAISLLLHHPYICGMREFITHPHHHYMVFEFIDGGQMLDYIISHGRLRERAARKFARQIGSALDYCHRNSIVHRDLKIENILISKNGNIKIIDFGLSNLYAPDRHLSTFCGSLYFAAPELLNAKPYTGPEVDIWSFGIVLYVLVCGKVPFDDQSMPALHAKIKRGLVEYPAWLSNECKSLLSRMLVTNPTERATLTEVLNHPFIVKGYDGPPDSHLIHREPLRADDLEWDIINAMGGFTFGTPEQIYEELRTVLTSEAYIATLAAWEARRDKRKHPGASTSSTALSEGSDSPKKKRFSAFDLKRILKKEDKKPEEPAVREKELPDPTRGFDPLISIYYLAKEKTEREKVFGRGHFASSQTSLERPAGGYGMPIPSLPVPGPSHAMGYDAPTRNDFAPMPRERAGDVPNPVMQHPSADRETTNIADVPTAHRRGPSLSQPPLPSASLQPSPIDKDHDGLAKRFGLLGRRRPSSSQRSPSASKPEVVTPSPSMPMDHRRTATASDKRHERRTSVGSITNTVGRVARRPSARQAPASPAREGGVLRSPREVDEDAERQLGRESIRPVSPAVDDLDGDDSAGEVKPVYLKGLFSVSTTSSKPAKVLYKEISGALDRLMVKYRPIKGGFECVYVPSIDLASVVNGEEATTSLGELNSPAGISGGATGGITNAPLSSPSGAKRRVSIKKKPSRSNLAAGSNGAGTGSRGTSPAPRGGGSSGTFSGGDAPTTPRKDRGEGRDTREGEDDVDAWALSVGGGAGTKMIVRFEIMVVKVPWLPLHGIQFRRVGGPSMTYSMVARTILRELKL